MIREYEYMRGRSWDEARDDTGYIDQSTDIVLGVFMFAIH